MSWNQVALCLFVGYVSASSVVGSHLPPGHYDGSHRTHLFDIRDFGAVEGGETLNTAAFEVCWTKGRPRQQHC
eukprot:3530921-Pyramimonas_sp.AAC.2